MTEEDLEESPVEIVPKNQLAVMVKESDLPEEESSVLMNKFSNFFVDVQVWEKKAKAIVVKDESQKVLMDQARQGRLFIRKIRIDIENTRKDLKEASLRKGKAIDKVAKFLKDALEPIETHLDRQEHFVEYREAEKEALVRAEIEKKMEEERLAEEKRKAEELEATRRENERLRLEKEEADRANREALRKVQEEAEKAMQIEREKSRRAEEELRLKKQADLKAEADAIRKAQALKTASDVVKLQKLLDDITAIQAPELTSVSAKRALGDFTGHMNMAKASLKNYIKSQQVNEEEL